MKYVKIFVISALFGLTLAVWTHNIYTMSTGPSKDMIGTVKAVCDYSYSINSGDAENACGIAQDINNVEYICPQDTKSAADCRVEVK